MSAVTSDVVSELPASIQAAIALGSGVRTAYERNATIESVFAQRAREFPDSVAVVSERRSLTYAEVERDANRVANHLIALGVQPGAAVGVALDRSVELPAVLLGILRAGATYVPFDVTHPRERVAFMLEDAGVQFVVGDERTAAFANLRATCVDLSHALRAASEPPPAQAATSESLAYIMYTSGSTGRPKGVAVEQRGVVRLVRAANYFTTARDETFLQFAPLAFDASTFEIWAPLLNGARLAVPKPGLLALDELSATIERHGVTTLWLTATVFREAVDARLAGFARLRQLLTGGDVVSPLHAQRFADAFPACRLINGYGPTENTTFSCAYAIPSDVLGATALPIGTPIANSSAYVLDAEMRPVGVGEIGELCVGGDGVARGYINLPALTAERFGHDPFSTEVGARLYRTGDRARWRRDGQLEFLGRVDDQVKVRGFRIELGEVEAALGTHPAVRHAAAVVTERDGRKDLVAHVVLTPGAQTAERELRAFLSGVLPAYMVPQYIDVRSALPRHASGKIDRVALARAAESPAAPPIAARRLLRDDGSLALERTISDIWAELLGRGGELDENFFDAGGDSVRLLAMHARLRERLHVDIAVTDVFAHGTIRKLAAFIARAQASA